MVVSKLACPRPVKPKNWSKRIHIMVMNEQEEIRDLKIQLAEAKRQSVENHQKLMNWQVACMVLGIIALFLLGKAIYTP